MILAVPTGWKPRGLGHRGPDHPRPPPLGERLEARKMSLGDNTAKLAVAGQNRDLVSRLDQGPTEACLPHTGAQIVRGCHITQGIVNPPFLSIALLWQQCRQSENTFPGNEGAYPSTMFSILSRAGFVESSVWPWNTDAARRAPRVLDTEEFDQRAELQADWADVTSPDDVAALTKARHLCGWGGAITHDFWTGQFDPTKPVGPAIADIVGAHEMTIVWHDAETDLFLMFNSWGVDWGMGGFFWATRAFIESGYNRETLLHAAPFPVRRAA